MTSQETRTSRVWPGNFYVLGKLQIVATTAAEAADELCRMAVSQTTAARHVHLVNAYTLALADKDEAYAAILSGDSINLPDGKPLSIVSRFVKHAPPLNQIRGPKFFLDAFSVGRSYNVRHYLLGSSDNVLEKLQERLTLEFPGCNIVGVESPPYRTLTEQELKAQDRRISDACPDIVWVGLGTPKQDREAKRLSLSVGVTCVAVGAAFDFAAGEVREAPKWMTRFCLEWLFRLFSEPRRLWRRYLFGNIKFMQIAWRCLVRNEAGRSVRR